MKILLTVVALLIVGCASVPVTVERSDWVNFAHPTVDSRINEISGENATNCGHYNLLSTAEKTRMKKDAPRCIKHALYTGQAFKFGVVSIVSDLYMHDVVIAAPDSTFWLIEYGVMIDQSDHEIRIERCEDVRIEFNPIFFTRKECITVDSQEWFDDAYTHKAVP